MSAGPICTAPPLTGGVAAETSGLSAPKEANLGEKTNERNSGLFKCG